MNCSTHKRAYRSPQEAAREARAITRRRNSDHKPDYGKLRPYHCPECKSWHLTKTKRSRFE